MTIIAASPVDFDPDVVPRQGRGSLRQRFWAKVDRGGPGGCWTWMGSRDQKGYGWVGIGRRDQGVRRATHVAWFLAVGAWPELPVLHRCDNPPCVNVAHLFLGTVQDNNADMIAKGRHVGPPHRSGSANSSARLTEGQVANIKRRLLAGESQTAIAADYPVTKHTIHLIAKGRKWTGVPWPR